MSCASLRRWCVAGYHTKESPALRIRRWKGRSVETVALKTQDLREIVLPRLYLRKCNSAAILILNWYCSGENMVLQRIRLRDLDFAVTLLKT
jgi:hypothetical protein